LIHDAKEVLATKAEVLAGNPKATDAEICKGVADRKISAATAAAAQKTADATEESKKFDALLADYAGYDKAVTIERIGNRIQVWAEGVIAKDVPATDHLLEVLLRLKADQVQTIVGKVAIGTIAKTTDGVRRFLEGCQIEQKLAVEKGAGAGK
jgi:hypothetical protein